MCASFCSLSLSSCLSLFSNGANQQTILTGPPGPPGPPGPAGRPLHDSDEIPNSYGANVRIVPGAVTFQNAETMSKVRVVRSKHTHTSTQLQHTKKELQRTRWTHSLAAAALIYPGRRGIVATDHQLFMPIRDDATPLTPVCSPVQ